MNDVNQSNKFVTGGESFFQKFKIGRKLSWKTLLRNF